MTECLSIVEPLPKRARFRDWVFIWSGPRLVMVEYQGYVHDEMLETVRPLDRDRYARRGRHVGIDREGRQYEFVVYFWSEQAAFAARM